MNCFNIGERVEASGDAALVGDHDDADAGLVQEMKSLWHVGENMEVFPTSNVLAFGHLLVQDSVAIEEDGVAGVPEYLIFLLEHVAIIATAL